MGIRRMRTDGLWTAAARASACVALPGGGPIVLRSARLWHHAFTRRPPGQQHDRLEELGGVGVGNPSAVSSRVRHAAPRLRPGIDDDLDRSGLARPAPTRRHHTTRRECRIRRRDAGSLSKSGPGDLGITGHVVFLPSAPSGACGVDDGETQWSDRIDTLPIQPGPQALLAGTWRPRQTRSRAGDRPQVVGAFPGTGAALGSHCSSSSTAGAADVSRRRRGTRRPCTMKIEATTPMTPTRPAMT